MRASTSLKTAIVAAVVIAAPLAGAYAAGLKADPTDYTGPHVTGLMDQIQGVDQGIKDAREANTISAAEARQLHMRTESINRMAERIVASDHGRIPAAQYDELLRRLDDVNQRLFDDTGSGFMIGDGADGGHYPNG